MPSADVTINRAIGVLMWSLHLDEHQAFRWLVDASQEGGATVLGVADDVLVRVVPHAA